MRAFILLTFPIAPHSARACCDSAGAIKSVRILAQELGVRAVTQPTHRPPLGHLGITKPVDAVNQLGVGYIPLEGTRRNLIAATLGDKPIHEALGRVVRFGEANPSGADYDIHEGSPRPSASSPDIANYWRTAMISVTM